MADRMSGKCSLHATVYSQSLLGGLLPHLAFFSISRCGLAVANCLMFTQPLWTAGIASILGSAPWTCRDAALSATSMVGVALVVRPSSSALFSPAGVIAGLSFGACGGLLNVLLSTPALRTASPSLLSAWQMGATAAFAVPLVFAHRDSPLGAASCSPMLLAALVVTGWLMLVTSWTRTLGLQRATTSAVATLLYTEIVWCFIFDIVLLALRPDALQLAGGTLIIGGAVTYALAPKQPLDVRPAGYELAVPAQGVGDM